MADIGSILAKIQAGDLDGADAAVNAALAECQYPDSPAQRTLMDFAAFISRSRLEAMEPAPPSHAVHTAQQLFPADASAETALNVLKQHELFKSATDQGLDFRLDSAALIWLLRNLRTELVGRRWMRRREDESTLARRLMQVADIHSPPRGYLDERAFKFLWSNLRYIARSRPPETTMVKCQITFQLGTREEWSKGLTHLLGRHLRRSIETEVRHHGEDDPRAIARRMRFALARPRRRP